VIVGAQWATRKGKSRRPLHLLGDVVVRFQGGANAGTHCSGRGENVLHLVPSGILHPGKKCIIGNGGGGRAPEALLEEIDLLPQAAGLLADPTQLVVSENAHVILPYHKRIDAGREKQKAIGTTGGASVPATRQGGAAPGSACATCSRKRAPDQAGRAAERGERADQGAGRREVRVWSR